MFRNDVKVYRCHFLLGSREEDNFVSENKITIRHAKI